LPDAVTGDDRLALWSGDSPSVLTLLAAAIVPSKTNAFRSQSSQLMQREGKKKGKAEPDWIPVFGLFRERAEPRPLSRRFRPALARVRLRHDKSRFEDHYLGCDIADLYIVYDQLFSKLGRLGCDIADLYCVYATLYGTGIDIAHSI
jgi:hypothetical protein